MWIYDPRDCKPAGPELCKWSKRTLLLQYFCRDSSLSKHSEPYLPCCLSVTMPFYSGFLLGMRILKSNAMPVQEVNYSIFNFPAPEKAQNGPVLEGTIWSAQLLEVANIVLFYPYCYPLTQKSCIFLCECRKVSRGKTKTPRSKPWTQ